MSAAASALNIPIEESSASPGVNPWLVALVVSMATFMEVLDTSIANVALPHIAGGLSASTDEATWVLTSYLVSNAIILPASGWLATVFGRKRFYMTCVALFAISSFLCGIAPSLGMLVFFRILQGLGGGGLAPSEQAILADTFPPAKRGMAFALYGVAVVVAPAVGPTLGGWITDNSSWRWVFFINVPVGILSLFLTHILVKDPAHVVRERKERMKIGIKADFIGFAMIALGLGSLQIVLDKGQELDWFSNRFILVLSIVAAGSLIFGSLAEWFSADPVVELRLLKRRTLLIANFTMFMLGIVLFGSTVLLPLFVQELLGYTATLAGLVLTPGGFFVMLLMPLVGFLVSRVQAKYLVAFGLTLSALALYHLTTLDLNADYKSLVWDRIFQTSGLAFLFVPINTAAYTEVPPEKNNNFSALLNLCRNLGGSVGISIAQAWVVRRRQFHQTVLSSHLTPYSSQFASATHQIAQRFHNTGASALHAAYQVIENQVQRQAGAMAYIDVFYVMAILCAITIPFAFLMKPNKPGGGTAMAH
ncbi:MAG TPA: DHA2 family efflux MFS transporter permease subunit [Tepidisphaeraceae bacterium]|nr:DHA2 family efflux MFS transporter permease subunit [Tepidisphaeraceae bacterium]